MTNLSLFLVAVPLRQAHHSAHGVDNVRRVILCRITNAAGNTGWGECPTLDQPGYITETTNESWDYLVNGGALKTLQDDSLLQTGMYGPQERNWLAARSCIVDACFDLELRERDLRLGQAIATQLDAKAAPNPTVARTVVIAAVHDAVDEVVQRAVQARTNGAALIKVKVDADVGSDQVMAVGAAIGSHNVAVDANGTFDLRKADHRQTLRQLDDLGCAYIEQPLSHKLSWSELRDGLAPLTSVVAFDESIQTASDIHDGLHSHPRACISIKPARLGGVRATVDALRAVQQSKGAWFVGGMLELGVGRATALGVAAQAGAAFPTDLGPSDQYVTTDITEPITVNAAGNIVVPTGLGCGRTPRLEAIDHLIESRFDL